MNVDHVDQGESFEKGLEGESWGPKAVQQDEELGLDDMVILLRPGAKIIEKHGYMDVNQTGLVEH